MATVRFPDGSRYPWDESAARHMQAGDTVEVVDEISHPVDSFPMRVSRIGVVTRRVWTVDEFVIHVTDPAPPTIERQP
jgi:hypothetical protein